MASLITSGLLVGCASNFDHFEKFYKPAPTGEGAPAVTVQPHSTVPLLIYSDDPDRDSRLLRQNGYVLIGTISFNGAPDISYAVRAMVTQGQKVGAHTVLLKARTYEASTSCCGYDRSLQLASEGRAQYFASYWAKSDSAKTSEAK
ncbi:MAG TPA: hypothetical protein VI653_06275 [Steroidobacteraceae bacterium]